MGIFDKIFKKSDAKKETVDTVLAEESVKEEILTSEQITSQDIIERHFSRLTSFEIIDFVSDDESGAKHKYRYVGEFIKAEKGVMIASVREKKADPILNKMIMNHDESVVMYVADGELFSASIKLYGEKNSEGIKFSDWDAVKSDPRYIQYMENIAQAGETDSKWQYSMVGMLITSEPVRHPKTKIRIKVGWDVFFKICEPDDNLKSTQEKWLADDSVPKENGLLSVKTTDVSRDEFSFSFHEEIPVGVCMEFDMEPESGVKTEDRIIGEIAGCVPDHDIEGRFYITVVYKSVPESSSKIINDGFARNYAQPINAEALVDISPDKLQASLKIRRPKNSGSDLDFEHLKIALAMNGVVHGIDEERLKSLAENPIYNRSFIVACGTACADGADAEIIYHVESENRLTPNFDDESNVDFKELGIVKGVKQGDLLCEKIPQTPGIDGQNLFGNITKATPGKDVNLPAGKNTTTSDDKLKVYAAMDGYISVAENKINVLDTFIVQGDVSVETGNIDFSGNVFVKGDVRQGFTIKSGGDINISGTVESAIITAAGSITISGGFFGGSGGELYAGRNATCKFIDGGKINVDGILKTAHILNAEVRCGGEVVALGKGIIRGSRVSAKTRITANYVGSVQSGGGKTVIEVGSDPALLKRSNELFEELSQHKKNINGFKTVIKTVAAANEGEVLAPDKEALVNEAKAALESLKKSYVEKVKEQKDVDRKILELSNSKIHIKNTAYEGTRVKTGLYTLILKDDLTHMTFYCGADGVEYSALHRS